MRDGVLVDNAFGEQLALAAGGVDSGSRAGGRARRAGRRGVGPGRRRCRRRPSPEALAGFQVGRHRAEVVGNADGVTYVDDSKATNPHAAQASITAYPRVVWIAGGLLKGASVDELVADGGETPGRSGFDRP